MCGIAGVVMTGGGGADASLLARMSALLAHRGPDGSGAIVEGPVGLAHRRLAIIDLSEAGRQPMTSPDGALSIVLNGEIFNYLELREELRSAGHEFVTGTDTEVVLAAYAAWGRDCLARFNGMFAFAVLDRRAGEVFLARDRLGVKPLYYARAGDRFLFASEVKALLADPAVGRAPAEEALATFLAWGVLDHSPLTMFDGVLQVPPGHWMAVGPEGTEGPVRWWDLAVNPAVDSPPAVEADAPARLLGLLEDAVRLRLRSDVPVGTCLSGGIDSSTVVALIARLLETERPGSVGARQQTFSAVYADPRVDERPFVEIAAGSAGVAGAYVEPSPDRLLADLLDLVWFQDEPFGSLSIYAQYCVMRLAAGSVTVVLDGQGADEQLAGYIAYQGTHLSTLARRGRFGLLVLEALGTLRHHRGFFADAARELLVRRNRRGLLRVAAPPVGRYAGDLDRVLRQETTSANLPGLLHYEDRNSMRFSLEARVPFLDYRVVEYLASLPLDQKLRRGVTKRVLRRAIRGLVPEEIRCRMDKMGFVTPEEVWMGRELAPLVEEVFASASFRSRPYWDADAVAADFARFRAGNAPYSWEVFRVFVTELWLRLFFDEREATLAARAGIQSE
ncbi:MAG: asparagine synthase (glutamine-hydrolyzing) [Methanospirillum sp.]|nr:asparagine synthase (glutamine-hydrolyzing) [Methanospirillum sp.]